MHRLFIRSHSSGVICLLIKKTETLSSLGYQFSKFFSVLDSFRKNFGLPGSFLGWQQLLRSNEKLVGKIGEFDVPQIYARLGDTQKALALLNRNDQERRALAFGPAIRESRSAHGAHSQRQG
jgi:hypothetical protein